MRFQVYFTNCATANLFNFSPSPDPCARDTTAFDGIEECDVVPFRFFILRFSPEEVLDIWAIINHGRPPRITSPVNYFNVEFFLKR